MSDEREFESRRRERVVAFSYQLTDAALLAASVLPVGDADRMLIERLDAAVQRAVEARDALVIG